MKLKKNKILICSGIVFIILIVMLFVLFNKKRLINNNEKEERKYRIEQTYWFLEYEENEKIKAKIINFRERNSIIIRRVELDYQRLYDYEFDEEKKEGIIYLYPKREVKIYLEKYTMEELLDMDYPVVEKFKLDLEKKYMEYEGNVYEEINEKDLEIYEKIFSGKNI
jgi:acetone carboxylase gamma subunit